jgi:hypothetical protein
MAVSFHQEPLPSVRSFAVVRVLVPEDAEEKAREVLARPVELPADAKPVADGQKKKKGRR